MILDLCWTVEGQKNRGFVRSYLETSEEKWKMYCLGRYNHFIVQAYPRLSIAKGRKISKVIQSGYAKSGTCQERIQKWTQVKQRETIREGRRETHRQTRTDMDKDWTQDAADAGYGNADPRKRIKDNSEWSKVRPDSRRHTRIGEGYS
jgi:hypothetical protein